MKHQYIIVSYDKTNQTMSFTGTNHHLKPNGKVKTIKVTRHSKARKDLHIDSTPTETFMLYYPTQSRLDLQTPTLFAERNDIEPDKLSDLDPECYYALLPTRYLISKDFDHFLKMIIGLTGQTDW